MAAPALTSRHVLLGMMMTALCQLTLTQTLQDVVDLRAGLMDGDVYHKGIRPVTPVTDPVNVEMYLSMKGMGGLDEKSQTMETVVSITSYWRNEFFIWEPVDSGGLKSLLVIQNDQWVPDVIVANSAEQFTAFGHKNLNTFIQACGKVQWATLVKIISNCDIDITYYPFDTQKCDIEFQPEFSFPFEMQVFIHNSRSSNPIIDYSELNKDGTWDIIDSAAFDLYTGDINYTGKQTLKYTFLLQRKTTYYILSLVLPVFFLSFTATLVFALPADAGEKMGTCITVLLSYAVYLTIVTDYLPETSLNVSLLGLYLVCLFGLCTFCVTATTFIIRVHFKPASDSIGRKTRSFTKYARRMGYTFNIFWLIVAPCCTKKKPTKEAREVYPGAEAVPERDYPEVEDDITWVDVAKALDWMSFLITTFLNVGATALFACILLLGSARDQPTIERGAVLNATDFANFEDDYYYDCYNHTN